MTMRRKQAANEKKKKRLSEWDTLNSLIAKTASGAAPFFFFLFRFVWKERSNFAVRILHTDWKWIWFLEKVSIFLFVLSTRFKERNVQLEIESTIIWNVLISVTLNVSISSPGAVDSGKLPIPFAKRQRNSGKPPSFSRTEFDKWFYPAVDERTCARHVSRVPAFSDAGCREYAVPTKFRKSRRGMLSPVPRNDAGRS